MDDLRSEFSSDLSNSNRAPTPSELALARAMITGYKAQLVALRSAASSGAQKSSRFYSNDENAILMKLSPLKQIVAPIRRVPDEIICKIFMACFPCGEHATSELDGSSFSSMSTSEPPILLTHISSDLKQIALSVPALWDSIHIRLQPNFSIESVQLAKEWPTKRARNRPLRIFFEDCSDEEEAIDDQYFKEYIDVVLSCCSRWQHIKISLKMSTDTSWTRIRQLAPTDTPLLQALECETYSDDSDLDFCGPILLLNCQTLTKLAGYSLYQIKQSTVQLPSLIHLSLELVSFRDIDLLTDVVRRCLSLVALSFYLECISEPISIEEIRLPRLRCRKAQEVLDDDFDEKAGRVIITEAIYAPQLEHLEYSKQNGHPVTTATLPVIACATHLTSLYLHGDMVLNKLMKTLRHCPLLITLHLEEFSTYFIQGKGAFYDDLLCRFVQADKYGNVLCPKLQNFVSNHCQIRNIACLHAFIAQKINPRTPLLPCKLISVIVYCTNADHDAVERLKKTAENPGGCSLTIIPAVGSLCYISKRGSVPS